MAQPGMTQSPNISTAPIHGSIRLGAPMGTSDFFPEKPRKSTKKTFLHKKQKRVRVQKRLHR
jgi:hypothetical protein